MENKKTKYKNAYKDAGVDINAGNELVRAIKPLIKKTKRVGADGDIGGFGGVFDLGKIGYQDPLLVAANDGVGTKLKIAVEVGRHDTIGIDLVAMCVNDLIVQGAEPILFLDYYACGKLNNEVAKAVIEGIAEGCKIAGCALLGGETAEMPGMYNVGEYDLAGFAVGVVEREELLPRSDMEEGDVLLGLQSDGLHSNGFSLVRHIIDKSGVDVKAVAPFDSSTPLVNYLLKPTRIYVAPLLHVLKTSKDVKALAHITGGGIVENIPRVLPDNLAANIDLAGWSPQPVFGWLKNLGNIDNEEMLRTFNCGIGMILVAAKKQAKLIRETLIAQGESAVYVGHLEKRKKDPVTFTNHSFWN